MQFVESRFGGANVWASAGLWKMGARRDQNRDEPQSPWAQSAAGLAAFTAARNATTMAAANATVLRARFAVPVWLAAWAASAVIASRDGVALGHNFYVLGMGAHWTVTVDDLDRSLGQHPPGYNSSYAYDMPLLLCAPQVLWCGTLLQQFGDSYRAAVARLLSPAGYIGSGAIAVDAAALDSTAAYFRAGNAANWARVIGAFLEQRVAFLKAQLFHNKKPSL